MAASTVTAFSPPAPPPPQAQQADVDAVSLGRLSAHLDRLLDSAFFNCADAEIVLAAPEGDEAGGATVAVHRCILAARSSFFLNHFSSLPATAGEKPRLELAKLVPGGHRIGGDALMAVLGYMYTGRPKVPSREAVVCIDEGCAHKACRPVIDFIVESTYAASGFQISELVSLFQRDLSEFTSIVSNEDMVPIIHVAFTCQIQDLLNQCIQKVATSYTFNSMYLEKELPGDTYAKIKEMRLTTFPDESNNVTLDPHHSRDIRNIHMALDSEDVLRIGKLLRESAVTLADAFAVHYASICSSPKVLLDLLKLESANVSANVNMRNDDGYTPLHMACMKQKPEIILSLIEKGASVLECTPDGRDALTICKRLTREKDFNRNLEQNQKTCNASFCVKILNGQTNRTCTSDWINVEDTVFTPLLFDNFYKALLYYENRVKCAKFLFPSEAKLALDAADAHSTEDFTGTNTSNIRKEVSQNENTSMEIKRLRFDALSRTVDIGRRNFPNCSKVLDELFYEELSNSACFACGTAEDIQIKRTCYYKLKEAALKALDKDKAAYEDITSTASSSRHETTTDSGNVLVLPIGHSSQVPGTAGTGAGQLESQGSDVPKDSRSCVGPKRKLKSTVWNEIEKVNMGGDWKGQCSWCKGWLSASSKNGTQHLHRHLKICKPRKAARGSRPI